MNADVNNNALTGITFDRVFCKTLHAPPQTRALTVTVKPLDCMALFRSAKLKKQEEPADTLVFVVTIKFVPSQSAACL